MPIRSRLRSRPGLPPGPALTAGLQLLVSAARPDAWLCQCAERYGDAFTLRLAGLGTIAVFTAPETTRALFSGDGHVFHASAINEIELKPIVGSGSTFTLDEDAHTRARQLLSPFFARRRVQGTADLVAEETRHELSSWPLDTPFALRSRLQELTLRLMLNITFGAEMAAWTRRLAPAVTALLEAGKLALPLVALRRDLGRWSPWGRFLRAREQVDSLVYAMIDRRQASQTASEGCDVLSGLVHVTDHTDTTIGHVELRDHLVTILIAGIETTSTALAWTCYELARHPHAQQAIRDERTRGENDYVAAVVKESLRLHPPVLMGPIPKLTEDIDIQGYHIPAGTYVTVGTVVIHRNSANYSDPNTFLPERFLGTAVNPQLFLPFGWGPHRCIGANLAQMEMECVLGTVLEAVTLSAADRKPERGRLRYVTCAPSNGVRVIVRKRAD